MNNIDLYNFLDTGKVSKKLSDSLSQEIKMYINDVQSKKGVKNVYGSHDFEELFSTERLIRLLYAYLDGLILEWDLEYILCYIELSFEIEEEKVEEVIFNFSDPYLGYPINSINVKNAIHFVKNETADLILYVNKDKELRKEYRSIFT